MLWRHSDLHGGSIFFVILLFCLSLSVPFLPSILLLPSGVQYRDKLNEWLSQVQKGLLFIEKKVESH